MVSVGERIVPYDTNAEQAVLGSLLVDGECIFSISDKISTEDFFVPENQLVYEACESIVERGEGINQITVARELAARNKLEECGGASYLSHLIANTPSSVSVRDYARIVRNLATQRRAISLGAQISERGYSEPDPKKLLSEIGKGYLKLQASVAMPQLVTPREWTEYGIDRYSKLSEGKAVAISTGFEQLDFATGGVFPGEYWIVASVTGGGKTTIALQWAKILSVFGNVLLASTEMGKGDILDRRIATSLKRSLREIRSGQYSEELYRDIQAELGEVSESNIFYFGQAGSLEIGGMTTDMLFSMANYMALSYGLKVIVVDYLQNLSDMYGKSLYERTTHMSRRLQNMARSLNIPIICLCQLNRELFRRDDKRPRLSDLRDSGCIAGDSLLWCRDKQKPITAITAGNSLLLNVNSKLKLNYAHCKRIIPQGIKPVWELTTRTGIRIKATSNHKFKCLNEWVQLENLQVGDRIAVVRNYPTKITEAASDIFWDEIKSITYCGKEPVFDVSTMPFGNFVANGFILHNSIEQDADVVLFLHRESAFSDEKELDEKGIDIDAAELLIAKQRQGDQFHLRIPLKWDSATKTYSEVERR